MRIGRGGVRLGFALTGLFCWQGAFAVPPPGLWIETQRNALRDAATGATTPASIAFVPNSNVTLLANVPPQDFSTASTCPATATTTCANDIWGYVSPSGREYAILGLATGTGFVDITRPTSPEILAAITDATSTWSDMSTYQTYAYNVNETGGGMQIFDLSQIDPPTRMVTLLGAFTAGGALQTSHNLTVNTDSGYAYLCGSNLSGGRLVAVSLANPASPAVAGMAMDPAYVHDAQVITYTEGPYAGLEIAFCHCGSSGLKIMNVTNKANMFTISTFNYPDRRYCHQGRVSEDRNYLFLNDELDELQDPDVTVTTSRVIDISDLANPQVVTTFTTGLTTIDHNLFVRGDFVFEANYTSGLHIFNVADVNNIFKAGGYDTYPFNDGLSFNGAWGVFVDYPSGVVTVSDQQGGLFIFDVSAAEAQSCAPAIAPEETAPAWGKQRYLSVAPTDGGLSTALRVTITAMPAEFAGSVGSSFWVDAPTQVADARSPGGSIWRSRLTCDPVYLDWTLFGDVQIADDEIVPSGSYDVQALRFLCGEPQEANFSAPLAIATAPLWGDVIAMDGSSPPDGSLNVLDVASIVDSIKEIPGCLAAPQADVAPNLPDGLVNVLDLSFCVDALKGFDYPFTGPVACP